MDVLTYYTVSNWSARNSEESGFSSFWWRSRAVSVDCRCVDVCGSQRGCFPRCHCQFNCHDHRGALLALRAYRKIEAYKAKRLGKRKRIRESELGHPSIVSIKRLTTTAPLAACAGRSSAAMTGIQESASSIASVAGGKVWKALPRLRDRSPGREQE